MEGLVASIDALAFDKLVVKYGGVLKDSNDLLVEQIRRTHPNARMCSKCGFGPMININCDDMMCHQGQVIGTRSDGTEIKVSNNCPECDHFDPDWTSYPPWNGQLSSRFLAENPSEMVAQFASSEIDHLTVQSDTETEEGLNPRHRTLHITRCPLRIVLTYRFYTSLIHLRSD